MDKHKFIGGAALCAAAGLWIGAAFAGAEEARADSSARSVNIRPQLILDSERLDYVSFAQKRLTLNSGWRKDGAAFVRPFNKVSAGIVRYGAVIFFPSNLTGSVKFVDAKGGTLREEKIAAGVTNILRGTFEQPGSLAAVRIEPSGPVAPKGVFVKPFRVTVGWAVDEDFTYVGQTKSCVPDGWRGEGAKVVDLPYLGCASKNGKKGFDRSVSDAVLEIAPGGFADPFVTRSARGADPAENYVFEFDALVTSVSDIVACGVRLRDRYAFTPDVWYHFRFEVRDGKMKLKLNGREIAREACAGDRRTTGGAVASAFAIENRSKTEALLIDDVKAYALVEPTDYPAAPIRPKGEEKWDVLLNVCPLWHNGYHAGWQCIEEGHGPHLVLGYYDEGLPETADWEIKYMVEHGIDVQLFCWYPESHDGPIRQPRNEFHLRDGFKNARYSHAMKYALIWEIQNAGRPHSLEAWKKNYVPYLIEHHFKDPRYYTVDGKAYLEVFGSWNFKDATSFGSASATKEALACLDGELKKIGLKGLYAVWCHGTQNSPEIAAHGFDAVAPYGYGTDGYRIEKQKAENLNRAKCPGAFAIPAVSVGFNSEPWHGRRYPMMTPTDFETSLKWVRDEFAPSQPHKTDWEKRVIILSNWNEYGEGTYLMPTEDARGFGYLDAIRAVFTDEKPDPKLNVRPTVAQRARICHLYPQTLRDSSTPAEVRYFSNAGDDSADGKTPQTAWRTIEKLNASLPAGGTARLRCGDTFYGAIYMPNGIDAAHPTVLTSWGAGPKPVVSATKNIKPDPAVWQKISHCFWRVDLRNPTNFTGVVTDDCNPGFLLVDGEVKPWKRFCHSDLVTPWDFCGEDGWLYVHADANPATLAKDIRVALRVHTLQFGSFSVVSNIAVRATGAHGMHGGWGCDIRSVRISDCDLENIGGSELPDFSQMFRIRYGNGIELGGDAQDVTIERCTFRGVYDVAFTMQGCPKKGWKDVRVRNCTMTDSAQAFEIWCKGAPQGVGFERCSFTGNHTIRVGGGWGMLTRPTRVVSTPLLIYRMDTDTVDIDVSGNTFEDAPRGLIYKSGGLDKIPKGYRIHDNAVKCSACSVNIWPQPAEMARSSDYAVSVGGRPVDVLQTKVVPMWLPTGTAQPYSFATFEAEGEVTVEVSLLSTNVVWGEAKVLPEKLGARIVRTADGKARITLKAPCTAQFEPNGRHRALVLAIQPRERNAPQPGDKGVVYVGPGVHRRALTEIGSGETLYLAPGAVLEGGVRVRGDNATVCGRGIVSGEPWAWQKGPEPTTGKRIGHLFDGTGRNLRIRDVVLTSSWGWSLVLNAVTNALVDNVKVLCGRVLNDDGIDICRAKDVMIRNSFVRAQDDCLAVKWWCDNLLMTNCTLMVDFANAVRVGYECESAAYPMRNIRLCDVDILHLSSRKSRTDEYWGHSAFCVQASHGQTFEDLLFENIRVAETEKGDNFLVARTMQINPGFRYHKGFSFDEPGHVTNLVFRNVTVGGTARPAVYLESYDAQHVLSGFRFENVTGCDAPRCVDRDLASFERLAVAADARPPAMRPAEGERYSTNRLAFALNNGLAMTRGGRIWASWIAGEDGSGAFTAASWSDDCGETWTDVKFVIDGHDGTKPERTNIIGTFWLDPDGRLRCYTDQSVGHFDGRAGVWELVCENPDEASPRWSAPRRICHGHVINKPIVLANGDWAMSSYLNSTWKGRGSRFGAFAELDGERGATCLVSADRGRTWEKRGTAVFPAADDGGMDWQESQLVELKDGTLRLFARVVDGKTGCLMAADSKDGGRTFGRPRRLKAMDHTNARFQIQRLKSGRLIFVKHGTPTEFAPVYKGRHRLTAYLSDDDGASWKGGLLLDAGNGSYPDLFQAPDGLIYVTHDHDRSGAAEIRIHRFTEEDILAQRIVSEKGRLGMLVSRAMASPCNRKALPSTVR